ncbi:MAG: hypothetical protein EP314_07965 [Bacteroidetes bacterium]|nr:MAG: hypothetical protein EP314_07965 [Bacteroidota bacterium]
MKQIGVMLLLAALWVGCEERTDVFSFDCVVYDQKVDAPVQGATVVMKVQLAAGGFNPNYQTVASAVTDANGRFYLEVEKDVYYSFRAEVTHPTHFSQGFNISPNDVPFSTSYSTTFNVEPKSWVSTRLINQNASQTVTFAIDAETANCTLCCSGSNTILQGADLDTTFTCQAYGEQNIAVNGTYVDENGGVHQIAETAYVNAFDTVMVTIVY